ncbi:MAG: hypothetical protein AAF928_08070 [Myxococcota bacterium]
MTKLKTFLADQGIDQRRLLIASKHLEKLRSEDRRIKLAQAKARKSDDGKLPEGLGKPRSGRPVTAVGLGAALEGKRVSGPMRTRILRAVNRILEQKKKDPVTLDVLFDVPKQNPPKPKAEAEGEETPAAS